MSAPFLLALDAAWAIEANPFMLRQPSFAGDSGLRHGVELALRQAIHPARPGVAIRGGMRVAIPAGDPAFPGEWFVRLELSTAMGPWEPACGPELGFGFLGGPGAGPWGLPTDLRDRQRSRMTPWYAAFTAEPLRFRLGDLAVSLIGLQVGSALSGGVDRFQIGYVRLERRL